MNPRKWILAAALVLQASLAYAGCSVGALPFNLQNNTLADATQVMGNFNQIVNGANTNCAASGANNDITALSALVTPIAPSQGGTPLFANGVDGGSANARTETVTSNWTATGGYHISAISSFTNTGPTTISVNGGPAIPLWRKNQFGISSTQGGELIAGHPYEAIYFATDNVFLLMGETIIIGEMKIMGAGAPPGYLIADGSTFVCTSFQDLCNVIGTIYGGTSSNPALPDTRGRVMVGLDNYGTGIGAAGRLTSVSTGCGSTIASLGAGCANANQTHTQIVAELATHNHGVNDSGHTHTLNGTVTTNNNGNQGSGSVRAGDVVAGSPGTTTQSSTTGISIQNQGSSQGMPIVNPNIGMIMIIRY